MNLIVVIKLKLIDLVFVVPSYSFKLLFDLIEIRMCPKKITFSKFEDES